MLLGVAIQQVVQARETPQEADGAGDLGCRRQLAIAIDDCADVAAHAEDARVIIGQRQDLPDQVG